MANHPIIETGSGHIGDAPTLTLGADGKLTEQQLVNLSAWMRAVTDAINGGLRLGDGPPLIAGLGLAAGTQPLHGKRAGNIDGQLLQHYFTSGAAEPAVHGLGRIPLGAILVAGLNCRAVNEAEWTKDLIYVLGTAGTWVTFIVV